MYSILKGISSRIAWKNLLCILLLVLLVNVAVTEIGIASPGLGISVSTDQDVYYLRHNVTVYGNLTSDGQPIPDGLVALQVENPYGTSLIFRTLSTGVTPASYWRVNVTDVILSDGPPDYNPKNNFEPGSWLHVNVTGRNNDAYEDHVVLLTVSVYDGNQNPIRAMPYGLSVPAGTLFWNIFTIEIPSWAYIGTATVYANVYTSEPKYGGTPYSPEASATFQIINVLTGSPGQSAGGETQQTNGSYSTSFRMSPEPFAGQYNVYVSSEYPLYSYERTWKFTSFEVKSASYPPQASFFYKPAKPYVNMTVTFDASASTADGGEIINYTWNFGDGSPIVVTNLTTITHMYTQSGNYTVTLNVTDSEGFWCATTKPMKIPAEAPPIAKFSWSPSKLYVNETVTFDASSSRSGWDGTGWSPIVSYEWDFGDGNVTTVGVPIITHVYRANGTYTVSLNITDTQGLWSLTQQTISVSIKPKLVGDVNGDGIVDIFDLVIIAAAYGSKPGDPNWDPRADLNQDDIIDIFDLVIVAAHYGETVSSSSQLEYAFESTSSEVVSASSEASYPPQASFFYTPPKPYVNVAMTLDASASYDAGGNITGYSWDFGDGTPTVTETDPIITHIYAQSGNYTVSLNVTDSEGSWCTTSKPIKIWPPEGPIAKFIWSPPAPLVNETVTFDASSSQPGWNGTGWAPIVSYTWNFDDGNITTTPDPVITHVYRANGTYTVSLNVTDTQGLWSLTQQTITVGAPSLVGDVNGDGIVDIFDLVIVAAAYGSKPGDPNWDPRADLNQDDIIDIFDLVIVASHYGETV